MPGYFLFSSTCKCIQPVQSRRARLGGAAPISQLINFIFTHLFLNALSDGRAAEVRPQSETEDGGRESGGSRCWRFRADGSSFPLLFIESYPRRANTASYQHRRFDTKQAGWLKALLHVGY